MQIAALIPYGDWAMQHGKPSPPKHTGLAMVAKGLLTSWVKLMLVGVDMPPVRVSMLLSLNMANTKTCQDKRCSIIHCNGNQAKASYQQGKGGGIYRHSHFPHSTPQQYMYCTAVVWSGGRVSVCKRREGKTSRGQGANPRSFPACAPPRTGLTPNLRPRSFIINQNLP